MSEYDELVKLIMDIIDEIIGDDEDASSIMDVNIKTFSGMFDIDTERIKELDKIFDGILSDFSRVDDIIKTIRNIELLSENEYMYMMFKAGGLFMGNFFVNNFDSMFSNLMNNMTYSARKILNITDIKR